jgi:hypothetical protein
VAPRSPQTTRKKSILDTTLIPRGTQYGATGSNAEQRKLPRNAAFAGLYKPPQPPATPDASLVMRLGQRFESARRLSAIGLSKPNTWGSEKPPIHRWEHLTPLRYKLGAVSISSTVFLSIDVMQCSADLHTGTDSAANRAASGGVIGNPYT